MDVVEMLFQLAVVMLGYLLGAGSLLLLLWLLGLPLAPARAAALVLVLPLVTVLFAEGLTGLWQRTPGTLGLGGLWAVFPLLIAGALAVAAAAASQRLLPAFDPGLPRSGSGLTGWLLVAIACSLVALALWRWWPEPRARLF